MENFVLEIANEMNEPWQQQINKFLELIKEANRLQKELAEVLLEVAKIENEMDNGNFENENKKDKPLFELTTPDNKTLLVYSPFIIIPKGSILTDAEDDANLKNPEEIKISANARCPDFQGIPRKIARILCPKYERGLNKKGIDDYDCHNNCIYRKSDFRMDGWNGVGYRIEEIQLRQFNIEI